MPTQEELFQLIKSLTPSEKRYFKVNASKGGDAKSNYMELFEAMDAQKEEYDEQKLKTKHSKKPFVKYLSAEKKQLREQVMKQMRAYRTELSIDNRIYELLQDERFYRDKGLKGLREKTLSKAKDLAAKYERFYLSHEILERELLFVEEFEEQSLTEPVLRLLMEQRQLAVNQNTLSELDSKNREIFTAFRSGEDTKNPITTHRLETAIAGVEIFRGKLGNSFLLQSMFYTAHFNYHSFFGNHQDSYEYCEKQYSLFSENPHFKQERPINYKICVANLISRARLANKTERFLELIEELKGLESTNYNEDGEVFQNVCFLEHLHYINIGDFEKAEALVPEIEDGLKKYTNKINKARYLSFVYNIMVMYFLMHRFKEAAVWIDKILEDKSEIKQGVTTASLILLPIIHYELGHYELVENFTRSAYRHLKSKKRLYAFEKLMINYLNKMPFSIDNVEFEEKLEVLSKELEGLFKNENEKTTFGMEEVSLWVRSKQKNVLMSFLLAKAQDKR